MLPANSALNDIQEAEDRIARGQVVPLWLVKQVCKHARKLREHNEELVMRTLRAEAVAEDAYSKAGGHRQGAA